MFSWICENKLLMCVVFVTSWLIKHLNSLSLSSFCAEKSISEVQGSAVSLWEEGRVEDELSPEEIQMVISKMNPLLPTKYCPKAKGPLRVCSMLLLQGHVFLNIASQVNQSIIGFEKVALTTKATFSADSWIAKTQWCNKHLWGRSRFLSSFLCEETQSNKTFMAFFFCRL